MDGQIGLERTPEEFVAALVEVFREVRRVLRADGTLWLNLGDCYAGSWGAQSRGNTASEASSRLEGTKTISGAQIVSHPLGLTGVGSLKNTPGLKSKDLVGIPWRVAFALQADGWYLRADIIWHKPNPMPESVTDRPTKAHEYLFLLSKSERYYYDSEAIKEPAVTNDKRRPYGSPGANALDGREAPQGGGELRENPADGRNRRSVWTVATQPYAGAHFATFPEKLIEPCILAGAPRGGVVLDPFCGSGTTVAVAIKNKRVGIGLDRNFAYLNEQARKRVEATGAPLFDRVPA